MVTSPDFEKGIREKIAARVDTSELEQELDGLKKKMRQLEVSKDKIAIQMDNLDVVLCQDLVQVKMRNFSPF